MQPQQPHDQGFARQWGKLVAQAWFDPDFKRRLLSEPMNVMRERGMAVPAGARLRIYDQEAAASGLPPRDDLDVLSQWAASGRGEEARELTLLLPSRPQDASSESLSRGVHLGPLGYPEKMEMAIGCIVPPEEPSPERPLSDPEPQPAPLPHPTPRPEPKPGPKK
ncbi:MAG: hypothetical protein JXB05_36995 [Myxococcaceae bacterium]|nr:hypothetical protein [Myxococcaceae bacterium]